MTTVIFNLRDFIKLPTSASTVTLIAVNPPWVTSSLFIPGFHLKEFADVSGSVTFTDIVAGTYEVDIRQYLNALPVIVPFPRIYVPENGGTLYATNLLIAPPSNTTASIYFSASHATYADTASVVLNPLNNPNLIWSCSLAGPVDIHTGTDNLFGIVGFDSGSHKYIFYTYQNLFGIEYLVMPNMTANKVTFIDANLMLSSSGVTITQLNNLTASTVPITASWAVNAATAPLAVSASYATNADTASFLSGGGGTTLATGSTYPITSSAAISASHANNSDNAINANTASMFSATDSTVAWQMFLNTQNDNLTIAFTSL